MLARKFHGGLEMDLQNLLSCIECHAEEGNLDVILETLKTIVNICAEEEIGKDAFRDVGGLDFLLEFLTNTNQIAVLEYTLKVLAFVVDGNVHNQLHLTENKVFKVLQAIFEKKTYPDLVLKNAILLFSTLLYQNRAAQDLISEGECLHLLMNYYKFRLPAASNTQPVEDTNELEIWLNVNSALCFAVNNPQNGKNQNICSALFPVALKAMQTSSSATVIDAAASFLSLCIADNDRNQDIFSDCDGLIVLKYCLAQNFEQLQSCMKECNNIISKKTLQIISSLIGVISASVSDHEKNSSLCGKLGIMSLMVDILSTEVLDSCLYKKIILTLGHCIDAHSDSRFILLDVPHLHALLKRNLDIDDEELHFATKYLLEVCLNRGKMLTESYLNEQNYSPVQKRFHNDKDISSQLQNTKSVLPSISESDSQKQNVFKFYKGKSSLNMPMMDLHSKALLLEEKINQLNTFNEKLQHEAKNITKAFETLSYPQNECNTKIHSLGQTDKLNLFATASSYSNEKDKGENSISVESDTSLQSAGHLYRLSKGKTSRNNTKIAKINSNEKHISMSKSCNSIKKKLGCSANVKVYDTPKAKTAQKTFSDINVLQSFQTISHKKVSEIKQNSENKGDSSRIKTPRIMNYTNVKMSKHENPIAVSSVEKQNKSFTKFAPSTRVEFLEEDSLSLASSLKPKSNKYPLKEVVNNANIGKTPHICSSTKSLDNMDFNKISESFPHDLISEKNSTKYKSTKKSHIRNKHTTHDENVTTSVTPEEKSTNKEHLRQTLGTSKKPEKKKMAGCVEVIVLPGVACAEHKLAAHFEMLKVCPLPNAQN